MERRALTTEMKREEGSPAVTLVVTPVRSQNFS